MVANSEDRPEQTILPQRIDNPQSSDEAMNANDSKSSDEKATNTDGRFATMIPEKTETEDDKRSVGCDDDAVGDAG